MERQRTVWTWLVLMGAVVVLASRENALLAMSLADGLQAGAGDNQVRTLPTLQRMVRHFDFEEAETAPFDMPIHFYRYGGDDGGAAAQGFPPFGTMRLTNEVAYSGNWSFAFELDGGSLAARVPTAVLPVVPLADYAITARVRTEGLTRARARLSAWLHDKHGNMIEDSHVSGDLIQTHGQWELHTVKVRGDYDNAADLVIELQLLQPRQFVSRASDAALLLDDVGGKAWFDDVTIWHLPRIELSTQRPGHVMIAGDEESHPALRILVRDLAHEDLRARLRIFDIDGKTVHDESFAAPRMPRPRTVALPALKHGWYRAVLELESGGDANKVVARKWLDFVLLAPPLRSSVQSERRFGVVLDDHWAQQTQGVSELVGRLGVDSVVLPMWPRHENNAASHVAGSDLVAQAELKTRYSQPQIPRRLLNELDSQRLHLTMAVSSVPVDLARGLDISPDDVLGAFAKYRDHANEWRDVLESLLVVGAEVQQWQLGSSRHAAALEQHDLQQVIDGASAAVRRLVSGSVTAVPLAAEHQVGSGLRMDARMIHVPEEVRPDRIPDYAEQWAANPSPYAVMFAPVHSGESRDLSPREQALDVFYRALYGKRAGIPVMYIDGSWTVNSRGDRSPAPAYVVWRQIIEHLHSRHFVGEMDLGDTRQCWLFKGDVPGDDVLVAWSDRPPGGAGGDSLVMQLADHPVTVVDMFGNAVDVGLSRAGSGSPGEHHIELGRTPVFIEGINLPLVQFRGFFALDPPLIRAEHRTHRHEIVLRNPWNMPLTGTLQIQHKPHWRISPRSHDFTIAAQGEARLPVEIVFDRSVLAGETALEAEVSLQADGSYRVNLSTPISVGLPHLDFTATWRIVTNAETGRDDLVIAQYIVNSEPAGSDPVFADAFLLAPPGAGVRQERRLVAGLEPGQMAIRMFHIPDGASLLAGQTIRVSLSDRNGLGRINRELQIPAFARERSAASGQPSTDR